MIFTKQRYKNLLTTEGNSYKKGSVKGSVSFSEYVVSY